MRAFTRPGLQSLAIPLTIAAAGAIWRGWIALTDEGVYWPDEIYQSLEPAHRLVFGYGIVPHEFRNGLRTWALPAFVAQLLILARWAGLTDPLQYVHLVKLVFVAISAATVAASYLLARAFGARPFFAAVGSAFFALAAPAVYLGPRALGENASALPAAIGLVYVFRRDAPPWQQFAGGLLLGLAVILRLQMAVICVGVVLALLLQRRLDALVRTGGALAIAAMALGLLDRLTWGGWFHSAIANLDFNLVRGGALEWGAQPAAYYAAVAWTSIGPLVVLVLVAALAALRRAWPLWLITALFVGVHTLSPHKEFRFVLPAIPLLGTLAGIGLEEVARTRGRIAHAAAALTLALALWQPLTLRDMTLRDIGQEGHRERDPVLHGPEDTINRLLALAGRQPDACGVLVLHAHWPWMGGYTYLHRPVPLYGVDDRGDPSRYNYVIAPWNRMPPSLKIVASTRRVALARTRTECTADPDYSYAR